MIPAWAAPDSTPVWLDQISANRRLEIPPPDRPVVIAVVDDGVQTAHPLFQGLLWRNQDELPDNGIDDDANGFVDDVNGWDVSDSDADITPPPERLATYYHGTHLAGIIAQMAEAAFGEQAGRYVRILPVKVLADQAPQPLLKDAYKGLDYALRSKADIVLTAWANSTLSDADQAILDRAERRNVVIVAAAGNFAGNTPMYPAAYRSTLAVTAIAPGDRLADHANYGPHIDLVAPGVEIKSASSSVAGGYEDRSGSSQAAAMVAGAMALLRVAHPRYDKEQLLACLEQGSDELPEPTDALVGMLGAGSLDVARAVACDGLESAPQRYQTRLRYHGYVQLKPDKNIEQTWVIRPQGRYEGIVLAPRRFEGDGGNGSELRIYKDNVRDPVLYRSFRLPDLPSQLLIPGNYVRLVLSSSRNRKPGNVLLDYRVQTINFAEQYCRGTEYLNTEGVLQDGSGEQAYAFDSNCKWQIAAPEGKRIRFRMEAMDTEAGVDQVLFFDGTDTQQRNLMAVLSGNQLPPEFTSWSDNALVWFVTESKNQGAGWQLRYWFVDP